MSPQIASLVVDEDSVTRTLSGLLTPSVYNSSRMMPRPYARCTRTLACLTLSPAPQRYNIGYRTRQIRNLRPHLHSAARGTVFLSLSKGGSFPNPHRSEFRTKTPSIAPHGAANFFPAPDPRSSSLPCRQSKSLKQRHQSSLHRDSASAYRGAKSYIDSHFPLRFCSGSFGDSVAGA